MIGRGRYTMIIQRKVRAGHCFTAVGKWHAPREDPYFSFKGSAAWMADLASAATARKRGGRAEAAEKARAALLKERNRVDRQAREADRKYAALQLMEAEAGRAVLGSGRKIPVN